MLIVLPLSEGETLSRVTSRRPLLYSALAESTSTSQGSARSFSNSLPGVLTLMLRTFLVQELGVEFERADAEACQMEHALSDDTMARWLSYLESQGIVVER